MKSPHKSDIPNSPDILSVSAHYAFDYYAACLDIGVNSCELLDILGCRGELLHNPVKRYSCDSVLELLAYAQKETGVNHIGLLVGQSQRPATFRDVGTAYLLSNTLFDAMAINAKYQRLNQQFGTTKCKLDKDHAWVSWTPNIQDAERLRPVTEAVYIGYVTIARWMLWQDEETIISIRFRHAKPEGTDPIAEYVGCEVLYGQPEDLLKCKASFFRTKLPQANPVLLKSLVERLTREMKSLENSNLTQSQVRQCVQYLIMDGPVNFSLVADTLGHSRQTLTRRLKTEGTSFGQILQDIRKENVDYYLKEGHKSLTEIAMAIGYNDQSAFTRAYKSWYGEAPSIRKNAQK